MSSAAIIVGIDAYAQQPLTSAVNDAKAFKATILNLSLVPAQNIQMFTAPEGDSDGIPTKKRITDVLYEFYAASDPIDRLFFFYAGHGLLTFSDAVQARTRTVLVPADVGDLDRDGLFLLDLDEVLGRMRQAGPYEQFFFIDACRDLAYERHPDVGPLGWAAQPPGPVRAQTTLYAVSPLGKALGQVGGLGVMTTHLRDALQGKGIALEVDADDRYVVTARSVRDYVYDAVQDAVKNEPMWKRKYMLPELHDPDPHPSPIRIIDAVDDVPFTVHIRPDAAGPHTQVDISLRRVRLTDCCIPPRTNHETVRLPPQRYLIEATSPLGAAEPSRWNIDLRKEHEAHIRVAVDGPEAPTLPVIPDSGTIPSVVSHSDLHARTDIGRVFAHALEPQVTIELDGLELPYRRRTGQGMLDEEVPAGPYRLRFRLGPDVYNETEIYVLSGEAVEVSPTVAVSPLVQEALEMRAMIPRDTVISETIGPIQAGILPTLLPILGIKPFDSQNELFHQFDPLLQLRDAAEFGYRPLSVVVAIDGNGWQAPPREVLNGIQGYLIAADRQSREPLILEPLLQSTLGGGGEASVEGDGFGRVGLALLPAPSHTFTLEFWSPHFGDFRLAGAALDRRVTVVTLTLRPDGSVDVSQNLLRFPGLPYDHELVPHVPYGRMLREIQLGQKLYASGELRAGLSEIVQDLFYGKWTDPILSCMAYFAWRKARRQDNSWAEDVSYGLIQTIAQNLMTYFGKLPDSRLVYGSVFENEGIQVVRELLDNNQIPVLADSAHLLALYATAEEVSAGVVDVARAIPPDQIWSLNFI